MLTVKYPFLPKDESVLTDSILHQGGSVVYPTETYYALGCAATISHAVEKIYQLKERRRDQPLLVLIDSWEMLHRYARPLFKSHIKILERYWPGPLTAILQQNGNLAKELNYLGESLGFRMTSSPIAREMIGLIKAPLVGTSANKSSTREASTCQSARESFGEAVSIYVDGGKTPGILPSTLVDMTTEKYTVVRKGMISI